MKKKNQIADSGKKRRIPCFDCLPPKQPLPVPPPHIHPPPAGAGSRTVRSPRPPPHQPAWPRGLPLFTRSRGDTDDGKYSFSERGSEIFPFPSFSTPSHSLSVLVALQLPPAGGPDGHRVEAPSSCAPAERVGVVGPVFHRDCSPHFPLKSESPRPLLSRWATHTLAAWR